jgi:hypothetical protein
MVKKTISFEGKMEKSMANVFLKSYRIAFKKSVEYLFSKVFENAPVRKTKSGGVNLRNALHWDFSRDNNSAFIGIPRGSEMEKVAFYTEMGTGERGNKGWTQWFNEKKPLFTVPIVPVKAKALHFVNEKGEDVFMKQSKGQAPQSWMRKTFYDEQRNVEKIWKYEFSSKKIKERLNLRKIEFGKSLNLRKV